MESVFDKILEYFEEKELKDSKDSSASHDEKIKTLKAFLGEWLVKASKDIYGMSMTTHPCTFVHPSSAKNKVWDYSKKKPKTIDKLTTPVIAEADFSCDGYVRSGNVFDIKCDTYGNAALMRYYKFLQVKLNDGLTIFQHIEADTSESKEILSLALNKNYEDIRNGFLAIKKKADEYCTSNKIKQVYFPVPNDDYHLLSVLMPSGIMSKLKEKINDSKFGDGVKELRETKKKNEFSEKTLVEYPDLTIVGFGGTKPQNISIINNENHGEYYFLPSFPPTLEEDRIKTPAKSFFKECLRYKYYASEFKFWHKLLKDYPDNSESMKKRDKVIQHIFDDILRRCFIIRGAEKGWSKEARCIDLPEYQKIFLDSIYENERQEAEDEFKEFVESSIRWIIKGYGSINGKESVTMLDAEFMFYKKILEEQAEVLLWQ